MKILILNWRDIKNPEAGGSEIYFHEISKRWVQKGHEVTWIVGGWKGCQKEEIIDKMRVIRVGKAFSLYFYAPFEYFKIKNKPGVVIDVSNGTGFLTPLFSRTKKILHIHHVHKEVWFKEMEGRGIKEKLIALSGFFVEKFIMPTVYRKTPIVTISESSKSEIEQEGYSNKVMGVVNPGIKFYDYKYTEKDKEPMILFLNRLKKYKGIQTFLEAIKILNDKDIKVNINIAGGGDYLDKAKKFSNENELNNVTFLGKVSEEKKKELLQRAWIFVNPSFKEGWGIVNIEANYFGTPVIGSDVCGIRDSIVNTKTGLLFEYGNQSELAEKIRILIKNKRLRKKMEKEAKRWANKFGWEMASDNYLKILERIIRTKD